MLLSYKAPLATIISGIPLIQGLCHAMDTIQITKKENHNDKKKKINSPETFNKKFIQPFKINILFLI
jgi:hypothetical protein